MQVKRKHGQAKEQNRYSKNFKAVTETSKRPSIVAIKRYLESIGKRIRRDHVGAKAVVPGSVAAAAVQNEA